MQVLQGMDPDKMVIILPSALVAMYAVISLQKYLCERRDHRIGLILPVICFIAATILAVRPLLVADAGDFDGLVMFCIRMWLTFNIVTLVFLFPYYKQYRTRKQMQEGGMAEQHVSPESSESPPPSEQ